MLEIAVVMTPTRTREVRKNGHISIDEISMVISSEKSDSHTTKLGRVPCIYMFSVTFVQK